ncbi:hypothetical protein TNCT_557931 [Trichonephila clavata]|uniref:Uncharacterized protein n=1 Tax=Trichonephila clavata TaxID=2740835 RepID=A0A8X6GUI9_TRICU|nr:hypothetical protein TNCT_557931 [Trichonephila clavata]
MPRNSVRKIIMKSRLKPESESIETSPLPVLMTTTTWPPLTEKKQKFMNNKDASYDFELSRESQSSGKKRANKRNNQRVLNGT